MTYYNTYSQFVKFWGQTSKNIQDVWKMCLEMTLCVYTCFVMFYVFVLDEIHVRGSKLIYDHVWIGKVPTNIPKDQPRFHEEGPKTWSQDYLRQPQTTEASMARGPIEDPSMVAVGRDLVLG